MIFFLSADILRGFSVTNVIYTYIYYIYTFSSAEMPKMENGIAGKFIDDGTKYSMDLASGRKRKLDNAEDSDEEDSAKAPPTNDIYRSRQQKKVVK